MLLVFRYPSLPRMPSTTLFQPSSSIPLVESALELCNYSACTVPRPVLLLQALLLLRLRLPPLRVLMLPLLLSLVPNRKQILVGDTLCSAGIEGDMSRVEALDWDQTVAVLGSFVEERWVPSLQHEDYCIVASHGTSANRPSPFSTCPSQAHCCCFRIPPPPPFLSLRICTLDVPLTIYELCPFFCSRMVMDGLVKLFWSSSDWSSGSR